MINVLDVKNTFVFVLFCFSKKTNKQNKTKTKTKTKTKQNKMLPWWWESQRPLDRVRSRLPPSSDSGPSPPYILTWISGSQAWNQPVNKQKVTMI